MNENSLVEIFCDGNETIGFGHIKRSIALADRLRSENITVRITGLSENATRMLPASSNTNSATVVLFDSPTGIDADIKTAKDLGKITIALDWFGEAVPDINIAVFPHDECKSSSKSFIGFEYIILRNEILLLDKPEATGSNNNVLICIGGGDLLREGPRAAETLSSMGFNVTLVQGPFSQIRATSDRYEIVVNPKNFAEYIAACDWAVTNGGGCFFEACYLGKASFILPQTAQENKIATFAYQKHAALGIGIEHLNAFKPEELQKVATNGSRLIDGKGAQRIVSIIQNLI